MRKTKKKNNSLIELEEVFEGNLDLLLFYLAWLKNELNATKAYKELHPRVSEQSASVLGSRQLEKVKKTEIMRAYDLDIETYFEQLKEGLGATKWNDFTGEREPDHKTRGLYHTKLGKLLGIETEIPAFLQQYNIGGDMKLEFIEGDESKTK